MSYTKGKTPGVVFEKEYELELVQAVLDDLQPQIKTLIDGDCYHLGNNFVDYIAEPENGLIRIVDARWRKDVYFFEFPI